MRAIVSVTITCAAFAAGCMAKQGTGVIGEADSQPVGQALATEIEDGAQGYGTVSGGATLAPSCVTVSGDTGDPDGDSIPNDAMLTFDCTDTQLGRTTRLTGTETVTDGEPSALAWAFSATADLHATLTAAAGTVTSDRSGTIVASQASPVGPFSLARTLDVTTVLATNNLSATVDETNAWTMTFTPQASWTPGGVVVTGSLNATGSWNVTLASRSADATLATPTPLTLTPACATRVTGGVVTGTFMNGAIANTITVTWTGCGASTVTFASR